MPILTGGFHWSLSDTSPFGWGSRIHRLHLCREVSPPPANDCPGYDTKQSDGEVPMMLELCGIRSTSSLPMLPGLLWHRMVASDRALSMGYIELNCILMLNWIVWNRTVWINWISWKKFLTIKLYLHLNCGLVLNWIVWNGTVFDFETVLTLNWIVIYRTVLTFNCV